MTDNAATMDNPFDSVNWQSIEPAGRSGREVFEIDGWHRVIIADSVGKPNNQTPPTGFGLTFYLKCVEGPDNGKTIDHFMNAFHNSAQAQEIGQKEVSAYCHATGMFKLIDKNASNLRNVPFFVRTQTVEEEYVSNGETKKSKRTYVRDFDTNNGTKHGSAAGNANGAATQTARGDDAPVAGWGAPPPSANGGQTPATAPAQSWGGNNGGDAPAKAPWNAQG